MPGITSTLTITNNSETKIISKQTFETPTLSLKKQDLIYLTQSIQILKDADVNLLTDLGKKQQSIINSQVNSNNKNTKKKQERTTLDDDDEDNDDDDNEGMNGEDDEEMNKTKKIKN